MALLWDYKNAPGSQGDAPVRWPSASHIDRHDHLPTLVMLAHPMCTCTRASLAELRVLMSEFDGRVVAHVLFTLPAGVGRDWTWSDTWAAARSIPGIRVHADAGGREAALFGGHTSGDVMLYGANGERMFHGGITGARGHVGENAGRLRLRRRRQGSDRKGRIRVMTRRDDDHVTIAMSDTGGGIPESVRSKIFEPFFTTKEVGRGTGQGLSIARNVVVQKHGGTLTFESEAGVGTTFLIRLPAAA